MLFFQQWLIFMLPFRMIVSLMFSFFSSISLSASVNSCFVIVAVPRFPVLLDIHRLIVLLHFVWMYCVIFFYNFHLFSIFSSIICSSYSLSSFLFVYFTDPILLFYYCYSYYSPLNWVFFRPYICGIVVARASFEAKGNSLCLTQKFHMA